MGFWGLAFIGVGLSMDAFAVSICTGLSLERTKVKHAVIVGLYFGVFQCLMPIAGYLLGAQFADAIVAYDHWTAFLLLGIIGGKMIWESRTVGEGTGREASLSVRVMLPLAIATSIDALAIGLSFAFLGVSILPAACLIGVITFCISAVGVKMGGLCGSKFQSKAELLGGIILILIGVKILLEHTVLGG